MKNNKQTKVDRIVEGIANAIMQSLDETTTRTSEKGYCVTSNYYGKDFIDAVTKSGYQCKVIKNTLLIKCDTIASAQHIMTIADELGIFNKSALDHSNNGYIKVSKCANVVFDNAI